MTPKRDEAGEYDVVVLGGGAVGEVAAQFAVANSDRSAAIVEAALLGGECSYWACMPSKALLRPIEVAATGRHLDGITVADRIDAAALLARRDTWVSHYSDEGQRKWASHTGIDVVSGRGRITGDRTVTVATSDGEVTLRARHAVIVATGSTASVPEIYADALPWTSRDATGVRETPDSVIVVGGGVVACEAATWLRSLGADVTMLVRGPGLLGSLDAFAGETVADALRTAGVDVRLNTDVRAVHRDSPDDTGVGRVHGGPVTVRVAGHGEVTGGGEGTGSEGIIGGDQVNGGSEVDLTAAEILVATGRTRTVDDIGLATVGVTDPADLSDVDWLHSVGDASFGPMLTHWGKYQARLTGQRIAAVAEGRAPAPDRANAPVPQVVFTDPQVASTGLSAREARADGRAVTVVTQPITAAAGVGLMRDDATGTAQIVVDDETRRLVGATFVGPEAGEQIHAATIAIVGGVSVDDLWHAVPSYPTGSEIWLRLLEKYFGY